MPESANPKPSLRVSHPTIELLATLVSDRMSSPAVEDFDQFMRLNPDDPFVRHDRQLAIEQAEANGQWVQRDVVRPPGRRAWGLPPDRDPPPCQQEPR